MGSCSDPSAFEAAIRRRIVLVVEDEILIRTAVADHLRDAGYIVVEAASASEAIGVFQSGEPVDIVFSDIQMPGPKDGLALARWVVEHHPEVPVLLTSGNSNSLIAADFISKDAFFSKPYPLEGVASYIRQLFGRDGGLNA